MECDTRCKNPKTLYAYIDRWLCEKCWNRYERLERRLEIREAEKELELSKKKNRRKAELTAIL